MENLTIQHKPVFIVAEAGVNHNGDRERAFELVDVAIEAGVDAVKFQTFCPSKLLVASAPKAQYQKDNTNLNETQYDMLSKLMLDKKTHVELKNYAEKNGLVFMSTAFDSGSLAFLHDELELEYLKIPSGEITNGPLLLEYGRTKKQLLLSTGMANIEEVREALSVLAFGFMKLRESPTRKRFRECFDDEESQVALRNTVILLHCTTQYPAPLGCINLRAMDTLRTVFGLRVGYSDHSEGTLVPGLAVAMGAEVIEKHYTLDRKLPGPDHKASLEPPQLKSMVNVVRSVELSLGDGQKLPRGEEYKNSLVARKSLVAGKEIKVGELFTAENLVAKRPGIGRSPMEYWDLMHSASDRDYSVDDIL